MKNTTIPFDTYIVWNSAARSFFGNDITVRRGEKLLWPYGAIADCTSNICLNSSRKKRKYQKTPAN